MDRKKITILAFWVVLVLLFLTISFIVYQNWICKPGVAGHRSGKNLQGEGKLKNLTTQVPSTTEPPKPCMIRNHESDHCIHQYFHGKVLQLAKDGIPDIGLTRMDPLAIKILEFWNREENITMKFLIDNIYVSGFRYTFILELRSTVYLKDKFNMVISFVISGLRIVGTNLLYAYYKEKEYFVPIEQTLHKIFEVNGTWVLNGDVIMENGEKRFKLDTLKIFLNSEVECIVPDLRITDDMRRDIPEIVTIKQNWDQKKYQLKSLFETKLMITARPMFDWLLNGVPTKCYNYCTQPFEQP